MKILAVVSTIDLKNKLGCTPAWWQLLKALYETGHEVIVVPYLGNPVESLWWRTYQNPCERESLIYNAYLNSKKKAGRSPSEKTFLTSVADQLIQNYVRPKWQQFLCDVIAKEKDISLLLFMSIPINHFTGIPSSIKKRSGLTVAFYDGDMPTILPKYTISRGFKFNYYEKADLSEYDAFFSNSKGSIPDIEQLGARNVYPLYYGIDADLASPMETEQDIDISFFGYGSDFREEWMEKLITIPSREMTGIKFAVAGGGFNIDLGKAEVMGDLSYSQWRYFACRSKINLNITRWSHTSVYASSTSRPFELASFGSCIVSQPYNGIQEWFEPGKELIIANSSQEAINIYKTLLSLPDKRRALAEQARMRVLKEHTYKHRANQLIEVISKLKAG
ncbi:MAG: glycosyltransferase [Chloroflexi bacterium]|nr:glycosyltransferase [Chloroflexota bacterium]